tara:strand:+ start:740 stop:1018 length:279 start_codon:yes stop_codon:yes gene_type:complete
VNTKFLDKVVDQILSETKFNFKYNFMQSPYYYRANLHMNHLIIPYIHIPDLSNHCRRIYSVGKEEMGYVIKEYKKNLYLKMRKECPKKYLFL